MKFGVVNYPGSNAADCYYVIDRVLGHPVSMIMSEERELDGLDCVVLPGGFSYGDYLRAGALAGIAPVTEQLAEYAEQGGLVLGIGNGFQVLLEAGLLPGAVRRNENLLFRCHDVFLRVDNNALPFTGNFSKGEIISFPIAHGQGNYYIDDQGLSQLEQKGQIVLRYCTAEGQVIAVSNPNGSVGNIAGVCSEQGNVFGLMPHPERCTEEILGNTAGLIFGQIKLQMSSILMAFISICIVILFFILSPFFIKMLYSGEWIDDTYREDVSQCSRLEAKLKDYKLTPAEMDVCKLLLEGYTLRQISGIQTKAYATINTHCTSIYRKLNINSRTQLLVMLSDYKEQ
jgi:phosphoribosylformylglycinamidine synthase I